MPILTFTAPNPYSNFAYIAMACCFILLSAASATCSGQSSLVFRILPVLSCIRPLLFWGARPGGEAQSLSFFTMPQSSAYSRHRSYEDGNPWGNLRKSIMDIEMTLYSPDATVHSTDSTSELTVLRAQL